MADAERDVRDRLAEALAQAQWDALSYIPWDNVHPSVKRRCIEDAGDLLAALPSAGLTLTLAALPTVGLRIGRVEE